MNPYVSLVFGLNLGDTETVQYEGRAMQLTDAAALEACKQ